MDKQEKINIILEQLRIRDMMEREGFLTWEQIGRKLGMSRQGAKWLGSREMRKLREIRQEHLTNASK